MQEDDLEKILEEILEDKAISEFAKKFIKNSNKTEKTIRESYNYLLTELGLTKEKIATHPHLLGRDPKSIRNHYQMYVGLLRTSYLDRNSGRDLLLKFPSILGMTPETTEGNIQYLYSMRINPEIGALLFSKPSKKREKLAWILREVFDYRNTPREEKKEVIQNFTPWYKKTPDY